MVAIQPELLAPLDLAKPQAMERLQDLVEFQIRASKSPNGAKQLSLTLNPEGLGRLRILAQTDGDKMRVMLKVEQGDAARLIERVLPHLEAQIAASVAMPVEFELVQEEILGNDAGLQLGEFADQEGDSDQADSGEEGDLVDQWTKHLEEPVLDLGQTLHVVA
jgi:flagellar hook-length control protein FliK